MGPRPPCRSAWVYISGSRLPAPPRHTSADAAPPPAQGGHAPLPDRGHTRRGARFLCLVTVHRASGGQCRDRAVSLGDSGTGLVLLSRPVVTHRESGCVPGRGSGWRGHCPSVRGEAGEQDGTDGDRGERGRQDADRVRRGRHALRAHHAGDAERGRPGRELGRVRHEDDGHRLARRQRALTREPACALLLESEGPEPCGRSPQTLTPNRASVGDGWTSATASPTTPTPVGSRAYGNCPCHGRGPCIPRVIVRPGVAGRASQPGIVRWPRTTSVHTPLRRPDLLAVLSQDAQAPLAGVERAGCGRCFGRMLSRHGGAPAVPSASKLRCGLLGPPHSPSMHAGATMESRCPGSRRLARRSRRC